MAKKTILLVDDDHDVRELMESQLKTGLAEAVEIVSVTDGTRAMQLMEGTNYDLIITDLQMPRKKGEDFIRLSRFSSNNEFVPTMVVTGFPRYELLEQFPPMVMLEKPIKSSQLVQKVKECFILPRDVYQGLAAFASSVLDGVLFFCRVEKNLDIHAVNTRVIGKGENWGAENVWLYTLEKDGKRYRLLVSLSHQLYQSWSKGHVLLLQNINEQLKMQALSEFEPSFFVAGSAKEEARIHETIKARAIQIQLQTSEGELVLHFPDL